MENEEASTSALKGGNVIGADMLSFLFFDLLHSFPHFTIVPQAFPGSI